jgi:hypothetical protein
MLSNLLLEDQNIRKTIFSVFLCGGKFMQGGGTNKVEPTDLTIIAAGLI